MNAVRPWPDSSAQKITGTEMMRASVIKFGMLMTSGILGTDVVQPSCGSNSLERLASHAARVPSQARRPALLQSERPVAADAVQGQAVPRQYLGEPLGALGEAQGDAGPARR